MLWSSGSTSTTPSPSAAYSDLSNSPSSVSSMISTKVYSPDSSAFSMHPDIQTGSYLKEIEKTYPQFRFRYKSEMQGTHGAIQGVNSSKKNKTFPSVKLCNYNGPAIIRCTLCTHDKKSLHVHRLVGKSSGQEKQDPHDIPVGPHSPNGYLASFQNLVIIHVAKKHLVNELVEKKKRVWLANYPNSPEYAVITSDIISQMQKEAEEETKKMDMNCAVLKFEALYFVNDSFIPIPNCVPIYSDEIKNLKCLIHGQLKICRMDRISGSCAGEEEIFLLVEKVGKDNIRVVMTEYDECKNAIWSDYCKFTASDVHHQFAIVCKTPKYRFTDIKETVSVDIQLERISDGTRSEPKHFKYLPLLRERENYDYEIAKPGKRKRTAVTSSSADPVDPLKSPQQQLNVTSTTLEMSFQIEQPTVFHDNTSNVTSTFRNQNLQRNDALWTYNYSPVQHHENVYGGDSALTEIGTTAYDDTSAERNNSITKILETLPTPDIFHMTDINDIFNPNQTKNVPFENNSYGESNLFFHMLTDGGQPPFPAHDRRYSSEFESLEFNPNKQLRENETTAASKLAPFTLSKLNQLVRDAKRRLSLNDTSGADQKDVDNLITVDGNCDISLDIDEVLLERTTIGNSALHTAIIYKQIEELHTLLTFFQKHNKIEHINCIHPTTLQTPLHLAVCVDDRATKVDIEMVNLLLDAGADPSKFDRDGRSPLHLAVKSNFKDAVASLLESPLIDIDGVSDNDGTALHVASENNNVELAELLIENGADINAINKKTGRTPLHVAVINENMKIISLLIEQEKLNINKKDFNGYSPMQLLILNECRPWKKICQLLLKNGATFNGLVTKDKISSICRKECKEKGNILNCDEIDFNIDLLFMRFSELVVNDVDEDIQ